MESQKTINSLEKTSDNKDLLRRKNTNKGDYSSSKEIKIEKPILSFSINHDSIA